jgi:TRAP transporter TAXI family solute receptor
MDRRVVPGSGPHRRGGGVNRRHCLALLAGAALLPVRGAGAAEDIRFFRIGTGPTGASYFPVGGMLASIISNPPGSRPCDVGGSCGVPGLIAVAQTSQGSVDNVEAIGGGQLDSGLCQADVAFWAYSGADLFQSRGPLVNLRAIANLFQESLHIVVRREAGIRTPADLKGKRVSLGEQGSGTLVTARQTLRAYRLSEKLLKPSYLNASEASEKMRDNQIDAFFQVGGIPVPAIVDLANAIPIDLLPIGDAIAADLRKAYPFLQLDVIPAGTYAGTIEAMTLGINAVWIVAAGLDNDLVYGITRALWHPSTRKVLDEQPLGRQIRVETAAIGLPVPLHPGAERYYAEAEQKGQNNADAKAKEQTKSP